MPDTRAGVDPDFGNTADDYARHRAGFPEVLFARLRDLGIGLPGQRIAGIDPAAAMLAAARRLDAAAGVEIEYRVAAAENTGLPDASQDVASAGQCWHWFDRPRAAAELRRILRPGGLVLIAHFDWIPLDGNLVAATETLIETHNPAWNMGGGCGLYPQWLRDLGEAGFEGIESFSGDVDVVYTPVDWRGRIRASAGVGGSLPPERVDAFDAELAALLARDFPGERLRVPHRYFAITARAPAAA